jgi:hypothetical protein
MLTRKKITISTGGMEVTIDGDVDMRLAKLIAVAMIEEALIGAPLLVAEQRCRVCGCTDLDCSGCIERTGRPCSWVSLNLCSACADAAARPPIKKPTAGKANNRGGKRA